MIHKFSRLLMTLVALFAMTAGAWADITITWGSAELSSLTENQLSAGATKTVNGITVTVNAGTNNFIADSPVGAAFSASNDNAFTFSTELGNFTKIECTSEYLRGTLGDGWDGATWTGDANSVNMSNASSDLVVSSITFTIGSAAPAGAQATFIMKEVTADMVPTTWNGDETTITVDDLPGFISVDKDAAKAWTGAPSDGNVTIFYSVNGTIFSELNYDNGNGPSEGAGSYERRHFYYRMYNPGYKIYYTAAVPLTVTWNATTKTGTFTQPASDVVLTPQYAPVAQWATESNVELLPTAAEGIFAGTTDPIIVEGTVAPGQGTVMYAVTTDATTAPTLAAFSATVPTAENIADEGADVLVWYYIQGANTPDGQEATAENTFNDSEICATPLEVSVLSNQFDITFNAANANTIENGKATVTVGGTAATVTEGKLEAVKMGSEVKMTAKQGYKFRKVEAKKKTILVTGITLNKTATTIVLDSTETLSVTAVTPDNANDKTVTWSSDKESVATVDANGKVTAVAAGTANITATANDGSGVSATCAVTVTLTYPIALSAVTSDYVGSVVCSDGNVYPAKTAVPDGKTAVGILGKVTETGHGLILALKNATNQNWNTINGWTSVTTYAGTTLKVLPDETARGTNLTSYTTLGSTAVSNWAVAQKGDYDAIFTNLGSTKRGNDGRTYDGNVNAYITTGVGGTALSGGYWSATVYNNFAWYFDGTCWGGNNKANSKTVRPVLGF